MKKHITLLTYLISFSVSISAQPSNSTIKGRVYDAKNNEPVGFATIVIQNTTNGTDMVLFYHSGYF